MNITVYTKPNCVQCVATYRALASHGFGDIETGTHEYEVRDLSTDSQGLEEVKQLGYLQAPVVVVRFGGDRKPDHWSGFRPDKIEEIAKLREPLVTV